MEKITLYVGFNNKDTQQQSISALGAYKAIENIAKNYTVVYSIFEADCVYKHDDGTVTIEPMIKVNLFNITETVLNDIVSLLKTALNQKEILVCTEVITRKVIQGEEKYYFGEK